ncbi:hypothetical protein H8356DRAFT_1373711 [Neocallimastix lanati (nom. inval.)]|nr:hypothetical protein H8356DRAFT_1373711 [Neocallimastix sp. JGI-2020a]
MKKIIMMDSNHCFGLPKIIIPKKKNIILELNDNNNKFGYYPLLYAIINDNKEMQPSAGNNNTEIVNKLLDYFKDKNITLELNKKDNYGFYLLF